MLDGSFMLAVGLDFRFIPNKLALKVVSHTSTNQWQKLVSWSILSMHIVCVLRILQVTNFYH